MKAFVFLKCWRGVPVSLLASVFCISATLASAADNASKGLVLFVTPPSDYPEIVDFVSLEKANAVFSKATKQNGQPLEIPGLLIRY